MYFWTIFQEEIYQTKNWKWVWYDRNLCPIWICICCRWSPLLLHY